MSLRGINNIFGWGFIIIGALRVLMIFLAILAIFSNLSAIYSGGAVSSIDNVSTLSTCIGFVQILLGLCSIVMFIINIFKGPEVVSGYGKAIGAFILCIIGEMFSNLLGFGIIIVASGIYVKAGIDIRENNFKYIKDTKKAKKVEENTGWFYDEVQDTSNDPKKQKKIAKLNEEINEWKQLLDSGEIDEQTFNGEKDVLIKKLKNLGANVEKYNEEITTQGETKEIEKEYSKTKINRNEEVKIDGETNTAEKEGIKNEEAKVEEITTDVKENEKTNVK